MRNRHTFFGRHRRTILALLFVALFAVTVTYATPPSSPYSPGETLDPNCAPGDANCSVLLFPNQAGNAGKYLTTDGTTASWATIVSNTFSTGLTNTSGTVTNNLSTGVSGGQSVIGGIAASDNLTLSSTTDTTKGKILFGTSAYDEANNRLGVGTSTPSSALDVTGVVTVSTLAGTGNRLLQAGASGDIGDSGVDPQEITDVFTITGAQNTLISGGVVSWVSGLTFDVSAADYYIQGDRYQSAATTVTLAAADPSNDRIDVIAVDINGNVVVIEGTPSATPSEPEIDTTQYLRLSFVYVPAAATAPQGISSEDIYRENTEWTTSTNQPSVVDFNYTTAPHAGTKSVRFSQWLSGTNATFVRSSSTTLTGTTLVFYIKTSGSWGSNARKLSLQWLTGGTSASNAITMRSGNFGFDDTSTGWQKIAIPISQWTLSTSTADRLRITVGNSSTNSFLLQFDDIQLQGGVSNPTPTHNGFLTVQGDSGSYSAQTTSDAFKVAGSNSLSTSVTNNTVTVALAGDAATPGNSRYYGTDTGGSKGWYSLPSTPTLQQVLTAGSTLTQNNTIDMGGNTLALTTTAVNSPGSPALSITDTGGSSTGLYISSAAKPFDVYTTGLTPAAITMTRPTVSSPITVLQVVRQTSGTAFDGIGAQIAFGVEDAAGANQTSNELISQWSTAADATRTSKFSITGVNSATTAVLFELAGSGALKFDKYGVNTFTGTPAYTLAVDASGNVIESALGSNTKINQLLGAMAVNTIDNADYKQEWQWNTLSGSGLKLSSTSTAAAGNAQRMLDINLSGANTNATQSTYGIYSSNTHSGTGSTNYGGYFTASGGTSNYGVMADGSTYGVLGVSTAGGVNGVGVAGQGSTGRGVWGNSSSNYGVFGQSTSSYGVYARTNTGTALGVQDFSTTTNDVRTQIAINRYSSGTAANGIGASIDFNVQSDTGAGWLANQLISKWTNATSASRTSQFIITGVNNAITADLLTLSGSGALQLNKYGTGSFSGTAAYTLAVDASGNVIESALGSNTKINQLLGATAVNTIDNADYKQEWQWNALTATGLKLSSTSTAAAGGNQKLFELSLSGANATSGQNTYGIYSSNTHTGTTSTNYAGYFTASGGTSNYGIYASASSIALYGVSTTGYGVYGSSTNSTAVKGDSTNGTGVFGNSGNSVGGWFSSSPSTTNTIVPVLYVDREAVGTAANGIGGSIDFVAKTTTGVSIVSGRIASQWTDATYATRTGDLEFWTTNSGTSAVRATIAGSGKLTLNNYGLGTFTGTPAYSLAVDASGNLIETTGGAGTPTLQQVLTAGSTTTVDNNITTSGHNFRIQNLSGDSTYIKLDNYGSAYESYATVNTGDFQISSADINYDVQSVVEAAGNAGAIYLYVADSPNSSRHNLYIYKDQIVMNKNNGSGVLALKLQNLPSTTTSNVLYYDSSTGTVSYGAPSTGSTPTLDQVMAAGTALTGAYNITGAQVTFNGSGFASYLGNTGTQYSGIYNYGNHEVRIEAYSVTNGDQAMIRVNNSLTNDAGGFISLGVNNSSFTQNHILKVNHNSIELSNAFDPVNLVIDNGLAAESASQSALCITSTGVVQQNTGAQTCTVSSMRFKHDIEPLPMGALEEMDQLVPSSFVYNGQTITRIGLIAEEVNAIDPRLVFYEDDGVTPRGVRYEDLAALTVKGVQELELKLNDIANFDNPADDTFVNNLRAWLANATNHITRIFTGEICLTDPDGSSECLDKTELGQLKQLIHSSAAESSGSTTSSTGTAAGTTSSGDTTSESTTNTTDTTSNTDTTSTQTDTSSGTTDTPSSTPDAPSTDTTPTDAATTDSTQGTDTSSANTSTSDTNTATGSTTTETTTTSDASTQ